MENSRSCLWIEVLFGSSLITLVGIFPAVYLRNGIKCVNIDFLLNVAVGTLLGEIFPNIFPELWTCVNCNAVITGLFIILAYLTFVIFEYLLSLYSNQQKAVAVSNLVANVMDNAMHGLCVVGSFSVSRKVGFITLISLIIHEIPHEVSDYIILLTNGLSRSQAIFFQLLTSSSAPIAATIGMIIHNRLPKEILNMLLKILIVGDLMSISLGSLLPTTINNRKLSVVGVFLGVFLIEALNKFEL